MLVDEYGGGSDGHDQPTVYDKFVRATGFADFSTVARPAADFVLTHRRLMRERPFLEGLGAVGPGHEWSIPSMFSAVLPGLRRAGFATSEIDYFELHLEQDCDHGAWLEEALLQYCCGPEAQAQVRRGTLASLEARRRFWDGMQAAWPDAANVESSDYSLPSLLKECRSI